MYTGYQIYQAERPRSAAEQRQADIAHAELARAVSRGWRALTAPLRALTAPLRARRQRGRQAGIPAGYRVTEGQAAEYQTAEYQAAECLSGRTA